MAAASAAAPGSGVTRPRAHRLASAPATSSTPVSPPLPLPSRRPRSSSSPTYRRENIYGSSARLFSSRNSRRESTDTASLPLLRAAGEQLPHGPQDVGVGEWLVEDARHRGRAHGAE